MNDTYIISIFILNTNQLLRTNTRGRERVIKRRYRKERSKNTMLLIESSLV